MIPAVLMFIIAKISFLKTNNSSSRIVSLKKHPELVYTILLPICGA